MARDFTPSAAVISTDSGTTCLEPGNSGGSGGPITRPCPPFAEKIATDTGCLGPDCSAATYCPFPGMASTVSINGPCVNCSGFPPAVDARAVDRNGARHSGKRPLRQLLGFSAGHRHAPEMSAILV